MTVAPIRIAVADDQPLFSAGLKMILRSQAGMDLVGESWRTGNGRPSSAIYRPSQG